MGAALFVLLASLTAEPPEFETFFKQFAEKRASVQMLEAEIVERTSQYEEITTRNGRVVFGKPRRIVFRYGDDDPVMLIDDRRVYEFDPEEEQLQIYDIEESPEASIFFLGFDDNVEKLREAYNVSLFTVQNDEGTQGIKIMPFKENMENAPFREVSIWLRDEDYLPFRIQIDFDDDTWMVTTFSNYQVNKGLAPAATQIQIPAGTRVIENREVVIHSVPEGGVMMPPEPLDTQAPTATDADEEKPAETSSGQLNIEELPAP